VEEADDSSRVAYEIGRDLLESGDLDAGIAQLEASVSMYPHFKTLELLGEAWLRKGEPLRAIVPLAAATTLNKQSRAPSLLAEALLATGELIPAHRVAVLALERDPGNKKARAVFEATAAAHEQWTRL
jgi:hypothetical protein